MKTNNKCAAVRLEKSKLVAALAILAVASVVIAAVPAVVDDSDAAENTAAATPVKTESELRTAITEGFNIVLGDNIKLANPLEIRVSGVIDLASYTLSSNSYALDIYNPATVTVKASGDGKVAGAGNTKGNGAAVWVQGESADKIGTFVLESGSIIGDNYGVAVLKYGAIEVKGGQISAKESAISGNGSETGDNEGTGVKITISGGTLTSTESAAIYFPNSTRMDITGGTITGLNGIEIRAGTVNISGAEITATGKATNEKTGNDGPLAYGMAIAVIDANYPGASDGITVTIGKNTILNGALYDVYVGDINGDKTAITGNFKETEIDKKAGRSIITSTLPLLDCRCLSTRPNPHTVS